MFEADDLAALVLWQEARGEPFEGKCAVGEVIRERMRRKFFSDGTIEDTCLRRSQFSGWNSGDPNRVGAFRVLRADPVFADCVRAWEASANTNYAAGALLYFNPSVVYPSWGSDAVKVASVGSHDFFVPAWLHPAAKPTP